MQSDRDEWQAAGIITDVFCGLWLTQSEHARFKVNSFHQAEDCCFYIPFT